MLIIQASNKGTSVSIYSGIYHYKPTQMTRHEELVLEQDKTLRSPPSSKKQSLTTKSPGLRGIRETQKVKLD